MKDPILAELVRAGRQALGRVVVAPLARGGHIRIEIDGMAWLCRPQTRFSGWGVFRIQGDHQVVLEREATPVEIERYALHCQRGAAVLVAAPGVVYHMAMEKLFDVHLCPDVSVFDRIDYCFDGAHYWYLDSGRPDGYTGDLQQAWRAQQPSSTDWTPRQQHLYRIVTEFHPDTTGPRLERALYKAGATLQRFEEKPAGQLEVHWQLRGQSFRTTVDARNLQVVSAGICLSGRDGDFDLTSIVPIMQQVPNDYGGW